jgi:MFS family permease
MSFRREYERWEWGQFVGGLWAGALALGLVPVLLWGWRGLVLDVVVLAVAYGVLRYLERPRTPRASGPPVSVAGVPLGPLVPGTRPHDPAECAAQRACPEHRPTPHRLGWRPAAHGSATALTVRRCQHGAHHPDPDDPGWPAGTAGAHAVECDGCCAA